MDIFKKKKINQKIVKLIAEQPALKPVTIYVYELRVSTSEFGYHQETWYTGDGINYFNYNFEQENRGPHSLICRTLYFDHWVCTDYGNDALKMLTITPMTQEGLIDSIDKYFDEQVQIVLDRVNKQRPVCIQAIKKLLK